MAFVPVLQFQGNCAAAMARYAEIFRADRLDILRYFEAPPEAGMPPSDLVLQADLSVGDTRLRGMDFPPGLPGDAQRAVAVEWEVAEADEGHHLFDLLAEGGWIIIPYAEVPGMRVFGLLRDRFGTHWMISTADAAPRP